MWGIMGNYCRLFFLSKSPLQAEDQELRLVGNTKRCPSERKFPIDQMLDSGCCLVMVFNLILDESKYLFSLWICHPEIMKLISFVKRLRVRNAIY